MDSVDTYSKLIALLDEKGASYRLIDHPPEGQTDLVSKMRGHAASEAAKCIILIVKIGKKVSRFVLAVVPGNARVDTQAIKRIMDATYVGFASADVAERLAGSVAGTVLPFSFTQDLRVIVDPSLKERPEIFFNAARLDRSIALNTADYFRIADPQIERIAQIEQAAAV